MCTRRRSIPACAGEPSRPGSRRPSLPVYPRVCGGTPGVPPDICGVQRSIPACAGEPWTGPCRPAQLEVYPRVCGGTCWMRGRDWARGGLSPRVRGNPLSQIRDGQRGGSIPACAGEPTGRSQTVPTTRVYPRVCGGTYGLHAVALMMPGLSPRVRGNLADLLQRCHNVGSIPACAGEPIDGKAPIFTTAVYPRVCGGTYRE